MIIIASGSMLFHPMASPEDVEASLEKACLMSLLEIIFQASSVSIAVE